MGLYAIAEACLTAVSDYFATLSIALPDRSYVHVGQVAFDCDQLVATFRRATMGLPGSPDPNPQRCVGVKTGEFSVFLVRCVPVAADDGQPPSAASLDAAGAALAADAEALIRAIVVGYAAGMLHECDSLKITGLETIGPEGGYTGLELRMEIQF